MRMLLVLTLLLGSFSSSLSLAQTAAGGAGSIGSSGAPSASSSGAGASTGGPAPAMLTSGGPTRGDPSPGSATNWPPTPWPPELSGGPTSAGWDEETRQRANSGSSEISVTNVDIVARTGDFGAASRTGAGTSRSSSSEFQSISGRGSEETYDIEMPLVGVDLDTIRAALRMGPSATPDRNGY